MSRQSHGHSDQNWKGVRFPDAGTWVLDPTHTTIEFEAKHLMIAKVKGRFARVRGRAPDRRRPDEVERSP